MPSSSGDSASTLDLDTSCTVHTSNRVQLGLTGGILEIIEGVNSPIALTDTRTYISSITFTKAKDPLGGTASVNYTFTMQSKSYSSTQEFGYQKTFLGGGTLRVE